MNKFDHVCKIILASILAWYVINEQAFGEIHFWDNLTPITMMVFAGWVVSDSLEGLFKKKTDKEV